MTNVAFIGLGVMGFPMAGHLQRNHHAVTVYNRTTEKAERWSTQHGGTIAATPAAENAALTVMCGGAAAAFERVAAVINSYAKACVLMGSVGTGQLTKMVNQICIAGVLQSLAEGMNFGIKAGLDMDKVKQVISKGAAQSWQMDNRAETMCRGEFEFGFAVDWMRKDLGISLAEGDRNGARLPVSALVDQFYCPGSSTRRATLGYIQPHASVSEPIAVALE